MATKGELSVTKHFCKIKYDGKTKTPNQLEAGGKVVDIKVFKGATPIQLTCYHENSASLLNSHYFLPCIASWDENTVATETYTYNFKDILSLYKPSDLWIDTDIKKKYGNGKKKMGPLLQQIFRDIISGLELLDKMHCNYDLDEKRVVFLETEEELKEGVQPKPRMIYIWSKEDSKPTGKSYRSDMLWKQLANLVDEVTKLGMSSFSNSKDVIEPEPHPEILAFSTMLRTCCRGRVASTIKTHPALSSAERLVILATDVRDYMQQWPQRSNYYYQTEYRQRFNNWISTVKDCKPSFQKMFDFWKEQGMEQYYTDDTSSLVYFVRNCAVHLYKHDTIKNVGLGKLFDSLFPEFFSYIFEKHVLDHKADNPEDRKFVRQDPEDIFCMEKYMGRKK